MSKLGDIIAKAERESQPPGNAVAKARFLFRWLCSEAILGDYNASIEALTKAQVALTATSDADTPVDIFILGVQIGRNTYSSAYGKLCSLAGIECRQVCGSLRGVGLRSMNHSSMKRQNSLNNQMMATHSWSLLTLPDNHKLLVCCQCAVQRAAPIEMATGTDSPAGDVEAVVDEFFFGTQPELFVCSHFPTETSEPIEKLHLLDEPFNQQDFFNAPLFTSALLALGLELPTSCRQSLFIINDSRELHLKLLWKNPKDAKRVADFRDFRYLFIAIDPLTGERLKDEDVPAGSKASINSLSDYCLFEISDRGLSFIIRFPENGTYRFVAFASSEPNSSPNRRQSLAPSQVTVSSNEAGKVFRSKKTTSYLVPQSSSLVPICEWSIEVDRPPMKISHFPFPKCQAAQNWGLPANFSNRFGVVNCGNFGARLETDENGVAEIYFRLTKPCIFSAKLKRFDETNPYGATVLHRIVKNVAVFTVSIPLADEISELGFEIFANDPSCDGKVLFGFCQFLVTGPVKSFGEEAPSHKQLQLYPALTSNTLGQHVTASEIGLKALSHPDPLIAVTSSKELELRFSTTETEPLRMIVALYFVKNIGPNNQQTLQDISLYTMHQTISPSCLSILCRFPHKGVYKLQLFAAKHGTLSDLPVVCTYAIFVNAKTASCAPFPKQLAAWNGGFLSEPKHGILEKANAKSGTNSFNFKLQLPNVRKIAIVVRSSPKERVILLNRTPDGDYEGTLTLDALSRTEVAVMANLHTDRDEATYSTLLLYNTEEMFQL